MTLGSMKDPQLGGSPAALPGASLQKACKFLVLFCALHLCVTLVYYMSGWDLRIFHYFVENQQHQASSLINSTYGDDMLPSVVPSTTDVTPAHTKDIVGNCAETSPLLVGPLRVEFNIPVEINEIIKANPSLMEGGRYKPSECKALQKVAIIIPFRKRESHLNYWLYYMHPVLQRQQLDYGVYIINQDGSNTFNRAKLLNIGYMEALKDYDYDCFVFSDVDIVAMDDRNIYRCFSQPRHISVALDKFGFGIASKGMSISRPDSVTGKCRMIHHNRDDKNDPNPKRFDLIARTRQTMNTDGINSLSYNVLRRENFPLYVKITVDVGNP
ncbi:hypothetical protein GDO86_000894 [Hymenochirus boettgeri]|uniref:Beta-1,4-galactosyltransferase n=1 Tax=Hymenochirus boettgeri TaxID=247094 RepID=A0A8T2KDG7_9PIPI|nr:hypothetical protein GDO86_000894 [Hymenochirus boettgeri]